MADAAFDMVSPTILILILMVVGSHIVVDDKGLLRSETNTC